MDYSDAAEPGSVTESAGYAMAGNGHKPVILPLRDFHCGGCGRRLYRYRLGPHSRIETRCPKCGRVNVQEGVWNSTAKAIVSALDTQGNIA